MSIKKIAVGAKRTLQWWMLELDRGSSSTPAARPADSTVNSIAYVLPADAPGGVGDDAMVGGVIQGLSESSPIRVPSIVVPSKFDSKVEFGEGAGKLASYGQWRSPRSEVLDMANGGAFYVLGADILDGHYSYIDAVKRIRMAKYASDRGLDARIIGFSLNARPHPSVVDEFNRLEGRVPLYLRDPISLSRAKQFIKGDLRLSADVAFLLPNRPSTYTSKVAEFAESERLKGRKVIGLNMHELFAKSSGQEVVRKLNRAFANIIENSPDCSFVLIPHDFRSFIDDRVPLREIYSYLPESVRANVFLVDTPIRASEIKQICSSLDGVFTGRMHLAIAALGMGVPIFGIVYQGKFEGLLEHFELDEDCVMDPVSASDPSALLDRFKGWILRLDELKMIVERRFGHVRALSLSNLS